MLHECALLCAASIVAAFVLLAVDVATWPRVRAPRPLFVSAVLSVVHGMALGVPLVALVWLPLRAVARARALVRAAFALALAAPLTFVAIRQAAPSVRGHLAGQSWALLAAGTIVTVVLAVGTTAAVRAVVREEHGRRARLSALVLFVLAVGLVAVDRSLLSAIAERTYSFPEGIAHLALTMSCLVPMAALAPRATRRRTSFDVAAIAGAATFGAFVGSRPVRLAIERWLPAVWEEPVYAARWLRRARAVESLVISESSLDRIGAKYDVQPSPSAVPSSSAGRIPRPVAAASPHRDWNVVVVFVDALRADVAHDPSVMPDTVAWMEQNQWYRRAYATGSSTVLSLVPMLGCRYDATPNDPARLLDAARSSGLATALFIPPTVLHYHRGHYPSFRFDHEEVIEDGFDGHHVPTASSLVERSLEWLRQERPSRFFMWLYHFDVHSWFDLDEDYVTKHAREAGFSKTTGVNWRYRAAARGVDQSFTELRRGLEELGLADRTVVLFVSDHGEALGEGNFWAHSTYLWESLIRVPMAMHVPGRAARTNDEPVSTIDLPTTLAPFIGRAALPDDDCHGVDLFASEEESRPQPISFAAMIGGRLNRIGMLGNANRKLVVDLRDADARRFRIEDDAFEEDVSIDELADLRGDLSTLVNAPIYPRDEVTP